MPFDYVPILVQVVVAGGVAGGVLLISNFLGTRRPTAAKLAPYESGMTPVGRPGGASRSSSTSRRCSSCSSTSR